MTGATREQLAGEDEHHRQHSDGGKRLAASERKPDHVV